MKIFAPILTAAAIFAAPAFAEDVNVGNTKCAKFIENNVACSAPETKTSLTNFVGEWSRDTFIAMNPSTKNVDWDATEVGPDHFFVIMDLNTDQSV